MEFRKILPAAAGIIALTATIAFAGDCRAPQEFENLRVRVSESEAGETESVSFAAARSVFRVSIEHGGVTQVVRVDARTASVIGGA